MFMYQLPFYKWEAAVGLRRKGQERGEDYTPRRRKDYRQGDCSDL